jgi:hypothetical protein
VHLYPGVSSGLIGLAFPHLNFIFPGTDPSQDGFVSNLSYSPVLFTAMNQGLLDPPRKFSFDLPYMVKLIDSTVFSLALTRPTAAQQSSGGFNPDLGSMAFGGFPPNINLTNTSVTAPIQGFVVGTGPSNATDAVDLYWTVDVQSFGCEGCNVTGSTFSNETILDSGTVLYICYPNCSHQ